ncbi:MAG: hypothetical protein ACREPI_11660 [Candidatus Dormibacterales bacterium]
MSRRAERGASPNGRLILLSTHIIGDVEAVASRLVLMNRGRLLADTSPSDLIVGAAGLVWSVGTDARTAAILQARYPISGMVSQVAGVSPRVIARGQPAAGAMPASPNLEDAYLAWVALGS